MSDKVEVKYAFRGAVGVCSNNQFQARNPFSQATLSTLPPIIGINWRRDRWTRLCSSSMMQEQKHSFLRLRTVHLRQPSVVLVACRLPTNSTATFDQCDWQNIYRSDDETVGRPGSYIFLPITRSKSWVEFVGSRHATSTTRALKGERS